MRRNDARATLEAARKWEARGMFKPGAFVRIEAELRPAAQTPNLAMQSLYVVGGILLGAATAALYALLQTNDLMSSSQPAAWWYFLVCAILLLGTATAVHLLGQHELGDALMLAGMVPLAILLGPDTPGDQEPLRALPFLAAIGILVFRHRAHLLPAVALGLALVALPVFLYRLWAGDAADTDAATQAWLALAASMWGGIMAWNRFGELRWDLEGAALTTAALIAAWVTIVVTVFSPGFDGGPQIIIALGLGALIGAGILLKERGVIATAAAALTIDAIVFAFDFGGPTVGLLTLVFLAAGLIAVATLLRRRKGQTTPTR